MVDALQAVFERHNLAVDADELVCALEDALSAAGTVPPYPAPFEALTAAQLELLARGGFELDGPELGLRDPVLRGAMEYAVMRATALTAKAAAARLGVNDSRVRQRLAQRELYGLKVDDEWRLPAFQFEERAGLVPNLDRVLPRLRPQLSALAVLHWLSSPNPDLAAAETRQEPVAPLMWLRLGLDPERVATLAAQL